ncbi:MAG TPA: hypothetical protein DEV93_18700, partial [Chloroflexi bacterium]|nr:hypothetical protein [Chloroflexota bacterium]
ANKLSGVAVTPRTLFRIASITKLYTATLVMQLVGEGKVDLDRPLVEQLPEFRLLRPEDTATVTPRHLLTHTSGISGDLEFPPARGDDALEQWVARLAEVRPLFSPGVTHRIRMLASTSWVVWSRTRWACPGKTRSGKRSRPLSNVRTPSLCPRRSSLSCTRWGTGRTSRRVS